MRVLKARNVNDAYAQGLALLSAVGERSDSRAGKVLVSPTPVTTVYNHPQERVLFDPRRDANPFFHLFESLWMMAGRRDASWLDRFVRDFSSRFTEPNGNQHGAYGFRWRHHFDLDGGGTPYTRLPDQLNTAVQLLRTNPDDRRVVLTMWDPVADLGADKRDLPCNTHIYLRIRMEEWTHPLAEAEESKVLGGGRGVLDMTVCCRSNDAIWGAYGANAVHFSVLQEYLAGRIGVGVGRYYQISNNFHAYLPVLDKVGHGPELQPYRTDDNRDADGWRAPDSGVPEVQPYVSPVVMGTDWHNWDEDLATFFHWTEDIEEEGPTSVGPYGYVNAWFSNTAEPLYAAHWLWRHGQHAHALEVVLDPIHDIASDWRAAAKAWMERRRDW